MGANSTVYITKSGAKQYLAQRFNDMLENEDYLKLMVDVLIDKKGFNCMIVADGQENEDHILN